jgi:hypothetical protein
VSLHELLRSNFCRQNTQFGQGKSNSLRWLSYHAHGQDNEVRGYLSWVTTLRRRKIKWSGEEVTSITSTHYNKNKFAIKN